MKKLYVTKKIEVKKYEQLNDSEKRDWYFDIVNYMSLEEDFNDLIGNQLHKFTNSELNYQYDLSGTQGAGVNIYGTFDIVTDGKKIAPDEKE